MKAKRAKGWACGFCRNIYHDDDHGKACANSCCLCVECGENPSMHTRHGASCRKCHNAKELVSALENMEHAKQRLADAERKAR